MFLPLSRGVVTKARATRSRPNVRAPVIKRLAALYNWTAVGRKRDAGFTPVPPIPLVGPRPAHLSPGAHNQLMRAHHPFSDVAPFALFVSFVFLFVCFFLAGVLKFQSPTNLIVLRTRPVINFHCANNPKHETKRKKNSHQSPCLNNRKKR